MLTNKHHFIQNFLLCLRLPAYHMQSYGLYATQMSQCKLQWFLSCNYQTEIKTYESIVTQLPFCIKKLTNCCIFSLALSSIRNFRFMLSATGVARNSQVSASDIVLLQTAGNETVWWWDSF
jgi:hypothetical protein